MSITAPPIALATITLPPGFTTFEQYEDFQGKLVTISITVAVAFGILVWDYFNLLPDEIKLYRTASKDIAHAPATWSFVVLRYSGILATLPSLFFTSVQSSYCQAAVSLSQLGVVLVVASSGIIFCYRVIAIWRGVRPVCILVGVVYAIMMGCWIAVATKYKAVNGPRTSFGSNCQMHPIVPWAPISYGSSVAFDATVLALMITKLTMGGANQSQLGKQMYQDSLIYFSLTAMTNITVLAIQALGEDHFVIKPTAVPFSTLITSTMGARVFLNLKLFDKKHRDGRAVGSSFSSSGTTGIGDFPRSRGPESSSAYTKSFQ